MKKNEKKFGKVKKSPYLCIGLGTIAQLNNFSQTKFTAMQRTTNVPFYTVQENVVALKKREKVSMKNADYDTGRRDYWWFEAPEDCFLVVPSTWFYDDNGREWIQHTLKATIWLWQESMNSNAKMEIIADIDNKRVVSPRIYSTHTDPCGELWVLPERREYLDFLKERRDLIAKAHSIVDELEKMGGGISIIETELH